MIASETQNCVQNLTRCGFSRLCHSAASVNSTRARLVFARRCPCGGVHVRRTVEWSGCADVAWGGSRSVHLQNLRGLVRRGKCVAQFARCRVVGGHDSSSCSRNHSWYTGTDARMECTGRTWVEHNNCSLGRNGQVRREYRASSRIRPKIQPKFTAAYQALWIGWSFICTTPASGRILVWFPLLARRAATGRLLVFLVRGCGSTLCDGVLRHDRAAIRTTQKST